MSMTRIKPININLFRRAKSMRQPKILGREYRRKEARDNRNYSLFLKHDFEAKAFTFAPSIQDLLRGNQ